MPVRVAQIGLLIRIGYLTNDGLWCLEANEIIPVQLSNYWVILAVNIADMSTQGIPSVDLGDFLSDDPDRRMAFVKALGHAYENIGFVAIKGHFLDYELTEHLYREGSILLLPS